MSWHRQKEKRRQRRKGCKVKDYTNSEISAVISERVHSERDRNILLRRYIDGITYEKLAEEFDLSAKQVRNIIYKYEHTIFRDV